MRATAASGGALWRARGREGGLCCVGDSCAWAWGLGLCWRTGQLGPHPRGVLQQKRASIRAASGAKDSSLAPHSALLTRWARRAVAVITASGVMRGTKRVELKALIDAGLRIVEKVGGRPGGRVDAPGVMGGAGGSGGE